MRPIIRGRQAAVSSMKAEATEVGSRILQKGGNAFDAIVGGQAALAVTDFALNGVGSDAVVLVYDAREKKVLSINAEPRAPKLATIEWYEKNSGGKLPVSDGLLSGGVPGVVDAWYILLDRWGTMSFEQVLQPAIDLAENGFPAERRARAHDCRHAKDTQVSFDSQNLLAKRRSAEGRRDLPESGSRAHPEETGRSGKGEHGQRAARGIEGGARSLLQGRHCAGDGGILRRQRRPVPLRGLSQSTPPKSKLRSPPITAAIRSIRIPRPARARPSCSR